MFRDISLLEAFERVADEHEWREFCRLKPDGDLDTWMGIIAFGTSSRPPTAREQEITRHCELWVRFADLVRRKLLTGEWVAEGFNPHFGARPVQIDARHWRVLEFALGHDRAEGEGYTFTNLFFSEVRPVESIIPHAERASLHAELVRWIEARTAAATGPMTLAEAREIARQEFSGTKISNHLFGQAWGAAKKPEHFRQKGRPKTKVSGF